MTDALANIVAFLHLMYFLFVAGGLICIVIGANRWSWVRNMGFRVGHLVAVYIVISEDTFGIPCPLNVLESSLRGNEGGQPAATGGVGGVLDFLLRDTISPQALDIIYWSLAVLLPVLFWLVPPRLRRASYKEVR
jgi:Protein of Unknown function (DUF2784)